MGIVLKTVHGIPVKQSDNRIKIGVKIGRLTVIGCLFRISVHSWRVVCECECGKFTCVDVRHLKRDESCVRSCGCMNKEQASVRALKHGGAHGGKSRLYRIWKQMKTRCTREIGEDYKWYGGKGVVVCDKWTGDFAAFREWAFANGYDDTLTIDRIDSDGNYEPNNCQWVTPRVNSQRSCEKRWGGSYVERTSP